MTSTARSRRGSARLRTYEEELETRLPDYATTPLINWDVQNRDVSKLLSALR